jgi:glycosyltransferase involved in cell wall biosynthesis
LDYVRRHIDAARAYYNEASVGRTVRDSGIPSVYSLLVQPEPDTTPVLSSTRAPRVFRNDWGPVAVPQIGSWTPTMTVTVIIPAFGNQEVLDLTLAGLAGQTYPSELLEVIVVDDGSQPPLRLPEIRPSNCRLLRISSDDQGWGSHNARQYAAAQSSGEIVVWLDSDIVTYPDHIEAQVRWQHLLADAVTIGYKRFIDAELAIGITPEQALSMSELGKMDQLFPLEDSVGHEWIERVFDRTNLLRTGNHLAFRLVVGASGAARRTLFDAAGGFNTTLRLGGDTELGYRLGQRGAVFIPVPEARSWHIGLTRMMQSRAAIMRYNSAFIPHLMPLPNTYRRLASGRTWPIPLVTAQVVVGDASFEVTRACVDRLLSCSEEDLRVELVGDWGRLRDERRSLLDDPDLELRLIQANYVGDPRVRLRTEPVTSAYPSPYLVNVSPYWGVGYGTVSTLIRKLNQEQDPVGLIRVRAGADRAEVMALWRTSAVERALRALRPGEELAEVVDEVYGVRSIPAAELTIIDLSGLPVEELGPPDWRHRPQQTLDVARWFDNHVGHVVRRVRSRLRRQ